MEENKNNPKKLWEQLKSLGYSTEQKENAKIVLDIDKGHCHDSNVIANYINHFFTNVASITYLSPLEGYCFSRSSAYQWVRIVPLF